MIYCRHSENGSFNFEIFLLLWAYVRALALLFQWRKWEIMGLLSGLEFLYFKIHRF